MAQRELELEEIEVELLLDGVYRHFGLDFRDYIRASIKRRLKKQMHKEGARTISGLTEKVLHDSGCLQRLLLTLSINVTSMFRDPGFYLALRKQVVPILSTHPFVRVWVAGCSTGEELYSLAIVLVEEGLYDRCRIYATDINEAVLHRAQQGIFPLDRMRDYTDNYIKAGGKRAFCEYYDARYGAARFRTDLARNVVFAQHNLSVDSAFNEFHLILCRNVLIYFNKRLQERVQDLFCTSLAPSGVIGLGDQESLRFTSTMEQLEPLNERWRLYRKIG